MHNRSIPRPLGRGRPALFAALSMVVERSGRRAGGLRGSCLWAFYVLCSGFLNPEPYWHAQRRSAAARARPRPRGALFPRRSIPPIEDPLFDGTLFTTNFIDKKIKNEPECTLEALDPLFQEKYTAFKKLDLYEKIRAETDRPPSDEPGSRANEENTKTDIIQPVLKWLGWHDGLGEIELPTHLGRRPRPDELHFASKAAKLQADSSGNYAEVLCVMEYKRWDFPLDIFKRKQAPGGSEVPDDSHAQILWYLRVLSHPPYDRGGVSGSRGRWGLLTNGVVWRLYFSGAPSVASSYFGLDFRTLFDPSKCSPERLEHYLQCFFLLFARSSFTTSLLEAYHDKCLQYETDVTIDLSKRVLEDVFPRLVRAFGEASQRRALPTLTDPEIIRRGVLTLLYRLLFLFYAEDRALLPIHHQVYSRFSFRRSVRDEVRGALHEVLSGRDSGYAEDDHVLWNKLNRLFGAIKNGRPQWHLPPYNGGLFEHTPLLDDDFFKLSDMTIYGLIRDLSFEHGGKMDATNDYINYRDLGVQQLGTLYEQLLDHKISWKTYEKLDTKKLEHTIEIFSRKKDGIYYTKPDLVRLLVRKTLDPLLEHCRRRRPAPDAAADEDDDPHRIANRVLKLKVCDPAMGSGHFLVEVVDYLSDRILELLAQKGGPGPSPSDSENLMAAIEKMRQDIEQQAQQHDWQIEKKHLINEHLVKRMVLKRCVYGVDKNEMAVELTKLSLWLHTFTVGVPLSFLDHHLRCGDSLFGARLIPQGPDGTDYSAHGFQRDEASGLLTRDLGKTLQTALADMRSIEAAVDTDLDTVHLSKEYFEAYEEKVRPLRRMFHVFHAMDWYKHDKPDKPGSEDGASGDLKKPYPIREFWPLARLLDAVRNGNGNGNGGGNGGGNGNGVAKINGGFLSECQKIRARLPGKPTALLRPFFDAQFGDPRAILEELEAKLTPALREAAIQEVSLGPPPPPALAELESLGPLPPCPQGHVRTDSFPAPGVFEAALAAEDAAALRFEFEHAFRVLVVGLLWHFLMLARQERFLHWEIEFLGVWRGFERSLQNGSPDDAPVLTEGGFDAIVSNPPWEVVKIQEHEYFVEHDDITRPVYTADRQKAIQNLDDLELAAYKRDQINHQRKRTYTIKSGAYPVMGSGDLNYYRLFVERAESLLNERGRVGMLMPSGIATDKTNAVFLNRLVREKRLCCLYDFENKKGLFPDVISLFRFCALVWQKQLWGRAIDYAVKLHGPEELEEPNRRVPIRHEDLELCNPNTKTLPMFVTRRDKELVLTLYNAARQTGHPILHLQDTPQDTPAEWRIKFTRLFDQTNDSHLFHEQIQLEKGIRAWKLNAGYGRVYKTKTEFFLPLYQARMIGNYDHRFNSIRVNPKNPQNPYVSESLTPQQKSLPHVLPTPYSWVTQKELERRLATTVAHWKEVPESMREQVRKEMLPQTKNGRNKSDTTAPKSGAPVLPGYVPGTSLSSSFKSASLAHAIRPYFIAYRDIARATDQRTLLASFLPLYGAGHTLGIFLLEKNTSIRHYMCLLANMNALVMDFVARNKIQGAHLSLFIMEQLPFLPSSLYDEFKIGGVPVGDLIASMVFELTYTAWDLAPLAWDFTAEGNHPLPDAPVPPPPPAWGILPTPGLLGTPGFPTPPPGAPALPTPWSWDEDRRRTLRARLDALFFLLYGITEPKSVCHVHENFPILRREAKARKKSHGEPDPRDLCWNYLKAYLNDEPYP